MDNSFGDLLKSWREQRRLSQLDLGLAANVSARHISFLETGRARPSRAMVLQLSETMQVPRDARNTLLQAAGFAMAYRRRDLSLAEMAPIRAAIAWTLQRHDPYPALALDKSWTVMDTNRAATRLLTAVGVRPGDSLLQAFLHNTDFRDAFDDWRSVARHMMSRLHVESAALGGEPLLDDAARAIAAELGPDAAAAPFVLSAIIPTQYRVGGVLLSLFSTIAQFGTAEDIALADLKIELMFPADDATRAILLSADTA